jgi:hypothetical protein
VFIHVDDDSNDEKTKALMAEYFGLDFSDVHLRIDRKNCGAMLNGRPVSYENLAYIFAALAEDFHDAAGVMAARARIESGEDERLSADETEEFLASLRG